MVYKMIGRLVLTSNQVIRKLIVDKFFFFLSDAWEKKRSFIEEISYFKRLIVF
jgi:hypothetical protein